MSLAQTPVSKSSPAPNALSHIHTASDNCPTCDQPIPRDRFEEIQEKIQARQSAQAVQVAARLQEQFRREKADALEQANREASATLAKSVASARDEERKVAEAASNQKLAEAQRTYEAAQTALQTRIDQANAAAIAAQQSGDALRSELTEVRLDHEASIQRLKQESEASVVKVREEATQQAEAAIQEKITAMERQRQESEEALQARIAEAQSAIAAAEESGNTLRAELSQLRLDHEAALQKTREEAEASAAKIREDATNEAEAAVQEKIANMERMRKESEAALQARIFEVELAKNSANQVNAALQRQIEQTRADGEAAIEKARQDAEARMHAVRQETAKSVEAAMQAKIDGAELARAEAESKALVSAQELEALKAGHEADVTQRLNEQREAMDKALTDAVNVEKSASFQKELKLQAKIDDMQRALDSKTNEELGEGAELDLYEELKAEFETDRIERINKGQPGADILHTVIHNGKECGTIIYDSKNHNAWRNDFVTKLAADQMAAKAEHGVLSTRKFPAGRRHLHIQDGVILAAPSRVRALVQILRQHIVQTHTLRWSNEERTQKTAALYAFINSERCRDLFKRIDTQAEKLLDLQVKEKKAHEANWKSQGELIRSVQKVQAEICREIDTIVGTAEALDQAVHE